ncbi:MAG: MvdC/MvdD family ATP grasp protein [Marinifilaceae bacterium]|jgi:glutathione synthase/RimK-type ligase-like ATP-grasp enzyme
MKKILIITHQSDNPSIETVSKILHQEGVAVFRFDSDLYPSKISVSQFIDNGEIRTYIERDNERHLLDEFEAIWYRRFFVGKELDRDIPKEFRGPILEESKRVILGMLETSDAFKLDDYHNIRRCSDKHLQLKLAKQCGLRIPKTLVTNNKEDLRKFFADTPKGVITKMQSSFAIYEKNVENVVFTNTLEAEHLEDLDDLQISPMQFQEKINKKVELRVTIVGDQIVAYSIDSQKLVNAKDDWRKEGATLLNQWEPFELPEEINKKLLQLMDRLCLNYGAIDLILTPENEYVFLEINPVGEFFWLDKLSEGKISQALANLLQGKGKRRIKKL